MSGRDLRNWTLPRFDGGLNTASDSRLIGPNQTPDCGNVEFTIGGGVKRRGGYAKLNATSLTGSGPESLMQWTEGRFVSITSGGAIKVVTDAAVNTVSGTRNVADAMGNAGYSFNGYFYTHNRVDGGLRIAYPSTGSTISAHPKAAFSRVLRNTVFVANTIESGLNFFSRLRWSDTFSAEVWPALNYEDVHADDLDQITGLEVVFDRLVIFKYNSIYMLVGATDDSFRMVGVSEGKGGCVAPRTIARHEGGVIYVGADGVKNFNGVKIEPLSLNIDPIIGNPISGAVVNRRYYLTVDDSGTRRIYVYDLDRKWWSKWSGIPASFLVSDTYTTNVEERLVAVGSSTPYVLKLDTGSTDDGSNIAAYYTTGWQDLRSPESMKRTRKIFLTTEDASGDLTLKVYKDWDDSVVARTVTAVGPTKAYGIARAPGMGAARALRFRIENTSGADMNFSQLTVTYTPRPPR